MNILSRKRYKWNLDCEKSESSRSMAFYNELSKIRPYFNDVSDIDTAPKGLVIEDYKPYLIIGQAMIVFYYLVIIVMFIRNSVS